MLRRLVEERATIGSNWKVSQEPPGKIIKGYGETWTGDNMDPDTALTVTTFLAGVRVLSEGVSSLPLFLYRRLSGGGKERAVDHPYYTLVHDAPNPEHTSMVFRELLQSHLVSWGNCFSQKIYNNGGQIIELWPLRPDRMSVERVNGKRIYHYRKPDGTPRDFPADDIMHIPGFGFDGLVGYSLVYLARNALALALATEKYGGKFFANDARPGIVLEHPKQLSPKAQENLKTSFIEEHGGADKSHGVFVAEEGMQVKEIGIPPGDAQFLETRRFQVAEIARILRVPLAMLEEHSQAATYASVEQFMLSFVTHTLRPWLVRWEQALSLSLLTQEERRIYFFEHLIDGLLRGDAVSRNTALQIQRQNGTINADEWREFENRNPLPDGEGKTYWMPFNMAPIGGGSQTALRTAPLQLPPFSSSENRGREEKEERARSVVAYRRRLMMAQRPVIRDVARRVLRREVHDVKEAARKMLGSRSKRDSEINFAVRDARSKRDSEINFAVRDAASFNLWLEQFYREHRDWMQRQFAPVMTAYGEMIAGAAGDEIKSTGWDAGTEQFVKEYIAGYATRHVGISEAQVRKLVTEALAAEGDPLEALDGELDDWEDTRADEIAMWESVREGNAVAKFVYVAAGIITIVWVASGTACDYCSALDGQVISVKKNFIDAGQDYQPEGSDGPLTPAGDIGHPPAHNGCECLTAAWF
jgi:HK97 family phage portal protein